MTLLIGVVHVVACLVLILVILLQAGRGQGLSGASMGGSSTQSIFGTRAADFLTKATTVSAILFLVTCISLDLMYARRSRSLLEAAQTPTAGLTADAFRKALDKLKASVGGPDGEAAQSSADAKAPEAGVAPAEPAAAPQAEADSEKPPDVPPAQEPSKP